MRKAMGVLGIACLVVWGFCAPTIKAAENGFCGTWILEKQNGKDAPPDLKNYSLDVTQNGKQLVVETHGLHRLNATGPDSNPKLRPYTMPGGAPGVLMGGGAGSGYSGPAEIEKGPKAMEFAIPRVTYSLDGKKTTAMMPLVGEFVFKAKLGKDGTALDLTYTHDEKVEGLNVTAFTDRERWTLVEGGQLLKVLRTVSTQQGSNTVNLVFHRKQAGQ